MRLTFHCPRCQRPVPMAPTMLGKTVNCPECQAEFQLTPALLGSTSAPTAKPATPAASSPAPLPPTPPLTPGSRPSPWSDSPPSSTPQAPATPPAAVIPPSADTVRASLPPAAGVYPTASPIPTAMPIPTAVPVAPTPNGAHAVPRAIPVSTLLRTGGAAPPAAGGERKVARFIATTDADSVLKPSPDGKLPELSLATEEGGGNARTTKSGEKSNPLVMIAAVAFSLLCSLMLLLVDLDESTSNVDDVEDARQKLQAFFGSDSERLEPYQLTLRESERALSRGDVETARNCYRKVLNLLHAEGLDPFRGLTGTSTGDEQLEQALQVLIGAGSKLTNPSQ